MSRIQRELDEIMFERYEFPEKVRFVSFDEDMTPPEHPEHSDEDVEDYWQNREEQDFKGYYY